MSMRKLQSLNPLQGLYNQYGLVARLRKDLNLVIISVAFGNICFYITGGSPFTGFAQKLGAGDFFFGLMMAVPLLGTLCQFIASWVLEKTRNRRLVMIWCGLPGRSMWLLIGLVPFFVPMSAGNLRLWIIVFLATVYNAGNAFVNIGYQSWISDLIPLQMRGRFLAIRSSVSTILGLVISVLVSFLLDQVSSLAGYAVVFAVAAAGGCMDVLLYLGVSQVPFQQSEPAPYGRIFKNVVTNPKFVKYLAFWSMWSFTWNLSGPYYMRYALSAMGLTFLAVTLCGQVAQGMSTAFTVPRWGAALDAKGADWVLKRALTIACISPIFWVFAKPGAFWPYLLFSVAIGIGTGAVDLTNMQRLITVTPDKNRSVYLAIFAAITTLVGQGLGNLVGGAVLEAIGEATINLGFAVLDRYQMLFLLSAVLRLSTLLLLPGMLSMSSEPPEQTAVPAEASR
jgi:MFS family permease